MTQFGLLVGLKWRVLVNTFLRLRRRSRFEFATLAIFTVLGAAGLFVFFLAGFRFFSRQEPFGTYLIDETFYLFAFVVFAMLFISSCVSAHASLFRSAEIPFLLVRNVCWTNLYFLKAVEVLWVSGWGVFFIAFPFMAAYGAVKGAGWHFPFACLAFYVPFVVIASLSGLLAAVLWGALFPTRRLRRIGLAAVSAAALFLFLRSSPEIIRDQGSLAGVMSGYLPHVRWAKGPLLPSCWTVKGILALTGAGGPGRAAGASLFYFLVLAANALFIFVPSAFAARRVYPAVYLRGRDREEAQAPGRVRGAWTGWADHLPFVPAPVQAFLEKDIKSFLREPAQWSQLAVFFGLLLFYFANLRNLDFHLLQGFWKNLVFVLNAMGTYIVLSSFNMRLIFPMFSLEGNKFWIVRMSPVSYSTLMAEKFALGTAISLVLSVPLVYLSGRMLEIPAEQEALSVCLGFFVCVALTGLSVGLGAQFPNFRSNNVSEIVSGFGGSVLLFSHLIYLALIAAFMLLAGRYGWRAFGLAALVSVAAGLLPLATGMRALERREI